MGFPLRQKIRRSLESTFRPIAYGKKGVPAQGYEPLRQLSGLHPDPSELIYHSITEGRPLCVGKLGRTELQIMQLWSSRALGGFSWRLLDSLATGDPHFYFFRARRLLEHAGITPLSPENHLRFFELMISTLGNIDILGSWAPGEAWFLEKFNNPHLVDLADIEPFRHARPWSRSLEARKVLVVHPYSESIKNQYEVHGDGIFNHRGVLPDFSLTTITPPQAYFGEIQGADDWLASLKSSKLQSKKLTSMSLSWALDHLGYRFALI